MKPNISLGNALLRIACGLTVIAMAGAKFTKKPWCFGYVVCMFIGGLKTASGILQFCPVTYVCQTAGKDGSNNEENGDASSS
jgi:hypothetical protein